MSAGALLAALPLLLLLAGLACGGRVDEQQQTPTPDPAPTGRITQPALPGGSVTATLAAECRSYPDGRVEIAVRYGARSTGDARVGRVRLYVNDQIFEDTGLISERRHEDEEIIRAAPGAQRLLRVEATPDGSGGRASAGTTVQCPGLPGPEA